MQELIQRKRVDAQNRLVPFDQALGHHVDGDLQRRLGCPLSGSRLQHPQLAPLDRKFHILHVGVVIFQLAAHVEQVGVNIGQAFFQGRLVHPRRRFFGLGQGLWGADAGDHVLALGVEQEFTVVAVVASGRVAGEADPGGAIVAHVAEDHGLDIDRRAPVAGNAMQAAVGDGAVVHPRTENGADGAPQLIGGRLRERLAVDFLDLGQIVVDQTPQVVGVQFGIQIDAAVGLVVFQQVLEIVVFDAQHHVAVHLDETAVAVEGEPLVAAVLDQAFDGGVVEAEVEDGVHHPRHGGARAGANGNQ